jgi:hypothetical protein
MQQDRISVWLAVWPPRGQAAAHLVWFVSCGAETESARLGIEREQRNTVRVRQLASRLSAGDAGAGFAAATGVRGNALLWWFDTVVDCITHHVNEYTEEPTHLAAWQSKAVVWDLDIDLLAEAGR